MSEQAGCCISLRRFFFTFALLVWGPFSGSADAEDSPANGPRRTFTILVTDPLAEPLSCTCVPGLGQRRYDRLAMFLSTELEQPVNVVFEESLGLGKRRAKTTLDFVIGKRSMVEFDAKSEKLAVRAIARLTNTSGAFTVKGAFVVRKNSPVGTLEDLKGRKLVLGPKADAESHAAARKALEKAKLQNDVTIQTAGSIEAGVFAVSDGEADATVITDYLPPLLEGCGKIAKGELRIIGTTDAVPFIELFATENVSKAEEEQFLQALPKVKQQPDLLKALESKTGFEPLEQKTAAMSAQHQGWTDWRGPRRDGRSEFVPDTFPKKLKTLWTAQVTGPALAGIAATDRFVVVPDKDADLTRDVFRCFHASNGKEAWTLEFPAAARLEYTNAPRAAPVIHEGFVYLLGALGDLHCIELATGKPVWEKHFAADFGAERPNWGWSSPPLVVDDKLIVNPGGKDASLVALDLKTGKTVWKAPGHAAAYSAFLLGTFSGVRQIVGYDVAGLGGWDPRTGERMWEMIPPRRSDFNVGTPMNLDGKLLVATENNNTRLYEFDNSGKLNPHPIAENHDLAPDTCSPVVSGGRVFCSAYGELFCLDLKQNLKTAWSELNDAFYDHTNLIAGNKRIIVWTTSGDLFLIPVDGDTYKPLAHLRPFGDRDVESMSHPAIVKDRLYLRDSREVKCLSWNLNP